MADLEFEWDSRKANSNFRKHCVSFEEAVSVFSDEHAQLLDDPGAALRLVVVVHCYREGRDTIRLLSARKATRSEQAIYSARWES